MITKWNRIYFNTIYLFIIYYIKLKYIYYFEKFGIFQFAALDGK